MVELGVIRAPNQILFGAGMVEAVGAVVARLGRRVLVVTDPHIAATPGYSAVQDSLSAAGLEVHIFDGSTPDVPIPTINVAVAIAADIEPEVIVGLGGGSSIDLAKLTALLLAHHGPIEQYYGENQVPGETVPLVAIPTTAGTGSEVTPVAVLSDSRRAMKAGISSPYLIPRAAICDPILTEGCPPAVTAYAGIDALAHAIEAYSAIEHPFNWQTPLQQVFVGKNRFSDQFALTAIQAIGASLVAAYTDGENRTARDAMLYGSLLAGLAFSTAGTAIAHALQYPLGAATNTPHGLGTGLLLPYAMQFNLPAREEALVEIAQALGVETPHLSQRAAASAAIDAVEDLARAVGIPCSLRDIGVQERDLGRMAAQSFQVSRLIGNNPRPLDEADLLAILDAAWHGDRQRLAAITIMSS